MINSHNKRFVLLVTNTNIISKMKKILPCHLISKLDAHEKLGVSPVDHRLTVENYIYSKTIKNIYKKISRNLLKQQIKLNYLNPYFFIELIEIHNIDIKFFKKLN